MAELNVIHISLSPPYPESGVVTSIVRMTGRDSNNLRVAAHEMGMNKATLMRILLAKGAERILRELGVTIAYEQDEVVELSKGDTLID